MQIEEVGKVFRQARLKKGWKVEDLAFKAGYSTGTIYNVEANKKQVSFFTLVDIGEALGLSIDIQIREKKP